MASNYTSSYQLCQWEGTDKVLRTDFNGDNQKIDTALAGLAAGLANKADGSDVPQFITGSYTGTGETNITKHYNLGGRPRLVVLRTENTYSGNTYDTGLLLTPVCCVCFTSNSAYMQAPGEPAGLEESGFYIEHGSQADTGLNREGVVQRYWALM